MSVCLELDPFVWDIALSDKVSPYFRCFVNVSMYTGKNKFFGHTRFHDYFTGLLKDEIEKQPVDEENLVGIQGIGKSSTIVYYVLNSIKNGEKCIHYIDMEFVKGETQMGKLYEYINLMKAEDILIIDHVTLFNRSTVRKIKYQALRVVSKVLLVETGFSASAIRNVFKYRIDISWQLDRNEFEIIWKESLKKIKFTLDNQDTFVNALYNCCKDRFILTPRLLQRIGNFCVRDENFFDEGLKNGKDMEYFMLLYKESLISDVSKFKLDFNRAVNSENMSNESQLCREFSLYTKLLLKLMDEKGETILTLKQHSLFRIAVNIFNCHFCYVSDSDIKNNVRFLELGLEKGDKYIKVTHLIPELSEEWKELFKFKIEDIIDHKFGININKIIKTCFELGWARKEFEHELVWLQYQRKTLIIPKKALESHCKIIKDGPSKFILSQCSQVDVSTPGSISFIEPTSSDFENMAVNARYKGHDKNVADLAFFLKKEIEINSKRSLLVYPTISNFKGIDYIVYTDNDTTIEGSKTPKRKKSDVSNTYALYLVQVATGASHTGVTIGEALNIFKDIIKNVTIHVMIIIVRKETEPYTLTGEMSFENASVINLTHLSLYGWLKESKLLDQVVDIVRNS